MNDTAEFYASHMVANQAANIPIQAEPESQGALVPLDDMADELADLRIVDKMINDWMAKREEIRARIAAKIGPNGEGTLNGRKVWAHGPTAKFAGKKFRDENPDLAEQFTIPKLVQELDLDALSRAMPSVYEKYRVSSLRPLGSKS